MITTPLSTLHIHVVDMLFRKFHTGFHDNHVHTRLSGYHSGGRLGRRVKVCFKRPAQSMSAGDFAATLLPLVTI